MGDRVGVELLYNWVEFGVPSSCQQTSRELETRYSRESHTRLRGSLESPDGVDPNIRRTRKTQRDGHNSGVKIWSLCSVSITLSHANLEQPFRTLAIKWEVNIFVKKSSCVFLPASLSCVVYSCVVYSCVCPYCCVVVMLKMYMYTTVYHGYNNADISLWCVGNFTKYFN